MRDTIRQVLQKLKADFKDDKVFTNPKKFRAALSDVHIETDAKKVRHVLNIAVRDMQVYSRLQADLADSAFLIDNLTAEMSADYMIDKVTAQMVIKCFAELLEYALAITPPGAAANNGVTEAPPGVQNLLQQAAQGDAEAQCALGDYFADERNPTADPAKAMQWYRKAAENGQGKAQWLAGAGYFNGVGVTKDLDQAKHWFQKSAAQNNPDGQYGLAGYYFSRQEYAKAVPLLRSAAEQGHADAKAMLEMAAPLFKT